MLYRGKISTVDIEARKARVMLPDKDDAVTPELPIAKDMNMPGVGEMVAVAFFGESMTDGLIVARF